MSDKHVIMDKMQSALRKADANHDGWITKVELYMAIKIFKYTEEEFKVVENLYNNAEKNCNGEISYDTVVEWIFDERAGDLNRVAEGSICEEFPALEAEAHDDCVSVGQCAQARAEANRLLKSLCLEEAFSEVIPFDTLLSGDWDDPLSSFFKLGGVQIDDLIRDATAGLAQRIQKAVRDGRAATDASRSQGNAGSKFTGMLQGGGLDVFYSGVANIVGEPCDDIARGVAVEHLGMQDSEVAFTTSNYGITTSPKLEYEFITNYSGECEFITNYSVEVLGTRRCSKRKGVHEVDRRTIRPIALLQKLDAVQKASLTWIEVLVVVLYTGPLFLLYNGILRGLGACGEVSDGVIFWSTEFSKQFYSISVMERMEYAGHKFPSTIHALVSAVKKLQRLPSGAQGTMVYRCLCGQDVKDFIGGSGFTEQSFTSTTQNLELALEYSGAEKGKSGTVLAIELSEVDKGAELQEFSQHPSEREILWNACSYIEPLKGREEWRITAWGPVKLIYVKISAGSKAVTVQELESRRKSIVVNMLETFSIDIQRETAAFIETGDFKEKLKADALLSARPGAEKKYVDKFVDVASRAVEQRVGLYRAKESAWYHDSKQFAQAVSSAAQLPLLAASWVAAYVEDKNMYLPNYCETNFFESLRNLCRLRQRRLEKARCSNRELEIRRHAAAICALKGYVHDESAMEKDVVEGGQESPLFEKTRDGDGLAVKLLIEAKASMEAVDGNGWTALHHASYNGHNSVVQALHSAGADLKAVDKSEQTALHHASNNGHESIVQTLLAAGADAKTTGCCSEVERYEWTSLHLASKNGHHSVVLALLTAGADVKAMDKWGQTALHYASKKGHTPVVQALLSARADVKAQAQDGWTAEELAAAKHRTEVVEVLQLHEESPGDGPQPPAQEPPALNYRPDEGSEAASKESPPALDAKRYQSAPALGQAGSRNCIVQ